MVCECGMFAIGVIVQLCSFSSWQQVAVGRLISGLGIGSLSAAVPMVRCQLFGSTFFQKLSTGRSTKQRQRQHNCEAPLPPHTSYSLH
jgi:MFS family permease